MSSVVDWKWNRSKDCNSATAKRDQQSSVLTGMIVLDHLKETLDYYARLEVAELAGDILKAITRGDSV